MGMRPTQQTIKRHLKKLANKYVGVEFRVLYASNGETAILPVNPATGKPELTDPAKFMQKLTKPENIITIPCECGATITVKQSRCTKCQNQAADVRAFSELEREDLMDEAREVMREMEERGDRD